MPRAGIINGGYEDCFEPERMIVQRMEATLSVWNEVFASQAGFLEMFLRGTAIYWALFALLRLAGRRDVGSLGTADLLVLVLVADAAGNAMSGGSSSVLDGIIVVATIVFWSIFIDRISYHIPVARRLFEPDRVCLVRDGKIDRAGMRSELISRAELMEQLRLKGIGSLEDVRRAYLEATGEVSVITVDQDVAKDTSASTLEET